MDTRTRLTRPSSKPSERGVTSVQVLVILVPVLFGLIGFAVDLGQLYLIRGELKVAANAMALAAAQQLIGTDQGIANASTAAQIPITDSGGFADKYNFGGLLIGQSNGFLNSTAPAPVYYAALQDALSGSNAGSGGSASRYAQVVLTADAPLTFWRFLPLATTGKVSVQSQAIAGISAPLCTACNIEPIVVAALNPDDTTDFGFDPTHVTQYTFAYQCTAPPTVAGLATDQGIVAQVVPYLLIPPTNQVDTSVFDEDSQLFRIGAGGIPGTNFSTGLSCFSIGSTLTQWADAVPGTCAATAPATVGALLCGIDSRFEDPSAYPTCQAISSLPTLGPVYPPDVDLTFVDTYETYQGRGIRVMTAVIVDSLTTLNILGFRQFLIEPSTTAPPYITVSDTNARFLALYIGNPVPVKQGRFDGCQIPITAGPGKVVLHQ